MFTASLQILSLFFPIYVAVISTRHILEISAVLSYWMFSDLAAVVEKVKFLQLAILWLYSHQIFPRKKAPRNPREASKIKWCRWPDSNRHMVAHGRF